MEVGRQNRADDIHEKKHNKTTHTTAINNLQTAIIARNKLLSHSTHTSQENQYYPNKRTGAM